jgi:inosine/xanthosine triphosphatase
VRIAFQKVFPKIRFNIEGVKVNSDVSDQPMTDDKTREGARNRAINAKEYKPNAQYWIGIEGGIHPIEGELSTFGWVYIIGNGITGKARTPTFFLPERITELVKQGKELGEADDIVFNKKNSKRQNGSAGLLTNDNYTRTDMFFSAIILALIPFLNTNLYITEKKNLN